MKRLMSLRARILIGAALWTAGLFILAGVFLTHLMLLHPQAPGVFHRIFEQLLPVSIVTVAFLVAGWHRGARRSHRVTCPTPGCAEPARAAGSRSCW